MPRPLSIPAVVFATLLPACSVVSISAGDRLPADALRALQPGVSTQADAIRELGPPGDVGQLRFATIFVYRLTEESAESLQLSFQISSAGYTDEERRFGALAVFFDRKGVLTGWGLSQPGKG